MKKNFLIVLTLLIVISLFAFNVFAEETKMLTTSFDTVGYTAVGESEVTLKDGQADVFLEENPQSFAVGKLESVYLRGWTGDTDKIETFGYKIDDGEFVAGEFSQATEEAVLGAGGEFASRFKVVIPVKSLSPGEHTATAFAKLEDGRVLEVASFPFTVTGEATNPGTGSDAILLVSIALAAICMTLVLTKKRVYN